MKHLALFLLLITFSCKVQSNDCSKFKTGTFKYTTPEFKHLTIIRNDSMQIETDSKSGLKLISVVEWISDCNYSLTLLSANKKLYDSIVGQKLDVNIVSTTKDSYKCDSYRGDTFVGADKIVKIKTEPLK